MQSTCRRDWKIGEKMNKVRRRRDFRAPDPSGTAMDKMGTRAACPSFIRLRAFRPSIPVDPLHEIPDMTTRLRAAAALLLLAAASCGDSTLPENRNGVSFRYSGALSGTFPESGDVLMLNERFCTQVNVFAAQVQDDGSYSMGLRVNASQPGIYPLALNGQAGGRASGTLRFTPDGEIETQEFAFTSGTVEITELTSGRVRGRFSGMMEGGTAGQLQVTDGQFNVEVDDRCDD
jgi:hypothetical protein